MKRTGEFMKIEGFIGDKYVTSYIKLNTESETDNFYEVDGRAHKGSIYRKEFEIFKKQCIVKF